MKIYVIIKGAKEATGEFMMATTEGAFRDPKAAQAWLNNKRIVWEETINGAECTCERAIHETELMDM